MKMPKKYPAKLLLFGEYTIIKESRALAIPLYHYSGSWQQESMQESKPVLQKGLPALLDYIKDAQLTNRLQAINVEAFEASLQEGYYFDSDIPGGYGLGSSGAVTAAVYDRFATTKIEHDTTEGLYQLKQTLADIESCFHGASSGAEPLVCYLDQPVLFHSKKELEIVEVTADQQAALFLIDTGISRKTEPLVKLFLEKCADPNYNNRLLSELIPLVDDAISAFLQNDKAGLLDLVHQISYFQFKYFAPMIPEAIRAPWLDCLNSNHSKLKLCGAGGGGCILGTTTNPEATSELLGDQNLIFLSEPKITSSR